MKVPQRIEPGDPLTDFLAAVLALVDVDPATAAVLVGVVNPVAAFLLAIATRGRVTPTKET